MYEETFAFRIQIMEAWQEQKKSIYLSKKSKFFFKNSFLIRKCKTKEAIVFLIQTGGSGKLGTAQKIFSNQ